MPNSNPACSPPYHCDCEAGETSYPVSNSLQLNYYLTNGTDTSTGTVTLKNDYETPCDWFGEISFVCNTWDGIKTKYFGFSLEYIPNQSECGWYLQVHYLEVDTPNATPGPCDTFLLELLSDVSNTWGQANSSCQCSPLQVGYYYEYDEVTNFTIDIYG